MSRKTIPTHILLNQVTLAAASPTVTFSNIPQGYSDLICVIRYDSNDTYYAGKAYVNGDFTAGNYTSVRMYGTGSATGSNANGESLRWEVQAATNTNATFSFMDYSATDKHKTVLIRADAASYRTEAVAARWASTAAITSITFQPGYSFQIGSTFSLYGVYA